MKYCTNSDILFLFLLTNVLAVSRLVKERLLNALNVHINVIYMYTVTKKRFPNGGVIMVTWETERDTTPTA